MSQPLSQLQLEDLLIEKLARIFVKQVGIESKKDADNSSNDKALVANKDDF